MSLLEIKKVLVAHGEKVVGTPFEKGYRLCLDLFMVGFNKSELVNYVIENKRLLREIDELKAKCETQRRELGFKANYIEKVKKECAELIPFANNLGSEHLLGKLKKISNFKG